MPSLFELVTEDVKFLEEELNKAEELGLDMDEAMELAIAKVDQMTKEKTLNYARLILSWEAFADSCKEASKRMIARGSARANSAQRLRDRMAELLPKDYKAEDAEVKISIRKSQRVDDKLLLDVNQLPDSLKKIIPETVTLDKNKAKEALKAGEQIQGLRLLDNYSVQIK